MSEALAARRRTVRPRHRGRSVTLGEGLLLLPARRRSFDVWSLHLRADPERRGAGVHDQRVCNRQPRHGEGPVRARPNDSSMTDRPTRRTLVLRLLADRDSHAVASDHVGGADRAHGAVALDSEPCRLAADDGRVRRGVKRRKLGSRRHMLLQRQRDQRRDGSGQTAQQQRVDPHLASKSASGRNWTRKQSDERDMHGRGGMWHVRSTADRNGRASSTRHDRRQGMFRAAGNFRAKLHSVRAALRLADARQSGGRRGGGASSERSQARS